MSDHLKRPNHLRLVTDVQEHEPPKRQRRRARHGLTAEQLARLRNAVRGLRRLYGTYKRLAEAMDVSSKLLTQVGAPSNTKYGSHGLAVKVARLGGVPVETILYGNVYSTDRCPSCGQPLPSGGGSSDNTR